MNVRFYRNLFTKKSDRLRSIDESSPDRPFALVTDDDDVGLFSPEMMIPDLESSLMAFDSSVVWV